MDTSASSSSGSNGAAAAHAASARVHHLPGHPLPFLASGGPLCCSGADEGGRVDLFARSLRRPLLLFLHPHVQATGDCAAAQHLRAVAAARPAWLRAEPQLEVFGVSTQPEQSLRTAAAALRLPYALLSDAEERAFVAPLELPCDAGGQLSSVTLLLRDGQVTRVDLPELEAQAEALQRRTLALLKPDAPPEQTQ
ncbi:hypothetical protein FA09DRAFT_330867 [Tilletiopsis washingtonensis]|uniref:Thioredoxin domain-containing protein n=1 Tax=Tilletiopsis washingtonensis TaxID=58919 RepID=A0A316Z6P2_9BASI|nr:hypothetical protein FA09DRAFT_330867 [Tilletiopsis washingtonensis]PWN97231.1 hypothetical protein FA09DRAFT_330867 [Tilletiopsis washingtonensis]